MSVLDVVVGRQPIFDRDLTVMGYELLFRTLGVPDGLGGTGDTAGARGDHLTAEVLFGSVSIGVERLVGNKKLFCNASRGVLVGDVPILLPPEQTVVEVLESVVIDEAVIAGCLRLRDEGFALALDDFSWVPGAEALLELASIVKIDLRVTKPADLTDAIEQCRRFDVELVAEKVETVDELYRCEELGFDYFQGYLLARPRLVPGRALDSGRLSRLRMSARLLDRECPMPELEKIVRSDPAMVHQLLQLSGVGAASGMRRNVRSVHEALVLVGWRRLQSWMSLLLMTDKGSAWQEEITIALTRARMCELVAPTLDCSLEESAFTAGMVSCFGMLLGMPLDVVLDSLPLDGDLRGAVLRGDGPLGQLVADVTDYLVGRAEDAIRSGLGDATLSVASFQALTWAVEMTTGLEDVPCSTKTS